MLCKNRNLQRTWKVIQDLSRSEIQTFEHTSGLQILLRTNPELFALDSYSQL